MLIECRLILIFLQVADLLPPLACHVTLHVFFPYDCVLAYNLFCFSESAVAHCMSMSHDNMLYCREVPTESRNPQIAAFLARQADGDVFKDESARYAMSTINGALLPSVHKLFVLAV